MHFLIESTYANIYRIPYKDTFACLKKIKKEKHYNTLKQEAFILSQFSHKNIIKVLDTSGLDKGELILELGIMDLFEYTRDSAGGNVEFLEKIFPQMQAAIDEVHSKGYIHIDIKLENFLVFPDNTIKLCDFGLAQKIDDNPPIAMRGTINYISPEMLMLKKITTKHDYWSFAICIYILLTGNDPWPGEDTHTIMNNIICANYHDFPKEIKKNRNCKKYIEFIVGELRAPPHPPSASLI